MKKTLVAAVAALLLVITASVVYAWRVGATPHSVTLNWKAAPAEKDSPPPKYNVYRSEDHGQSFHRIASKLTTTTYEDTQVKRGKTYRYTVTSVDEKGFESVRAEAVEVTVPK